MYARVPTFKISSDKIDASIRFFTEMSLPQIRKMPGWKGVTLFVDRQKGMTRVISYFDTAEDFAASDDAARGLRGGYMEELGAELVSLEKWEVAVDEFPQSAAGDMGGRRAA